ncbi:MAG: hypothetical protein ACRC9T_02435, partial [Vibrionaceae bacterium]
QWLGEHTLENFITGLGVVVNDPSRTHLRRMGDGFALLAGQEFFSGSTAICNPQDQLLRNLSPEDNDTFSRALNGLIVGSQDPFIKELNERWGAQGESAANEQSPPPQKNKQKRSSKRGRAKKKHSTKHGHTKEGKSSTKTSWRDAQELFNANYTESYNEFKKKIAGFDLEEEQRNNPQVPLVGRQQAIEAFGSLLGDALNFTSTKLADKYGLNLNPKTNPGKDGFWSWLDNYTDWAAKAFSQATHYFDTEAQVIELEIEAKSTEELQKLDKELAKLAHKIARKSEYADTETHELINQLVKAARKVMDLNDSSLSLAERRRLAREIVRKNAPRAHRITEKFEPFYEFAGGPIKSILEPDVAYGSKATGSNLDEN